MVVVAKIDPKQLKRIVDSKEYENLFEKIDKNTNNQTPVFAILEFIHHETQLPDEECVVLLSAYTYRNKKNDKNQKTNQ